MPLLLLRYTPIRRTSHHIIDTLFTTLRHYDFMTLRLYDNIAPPLHSDLIYLDDHIIQIVSTVLMITVWSKLRKYVRVPGFYS